jgi:hypothetical protein
MKERDLAWKFSEAEQSAGNTEWITVYYGESISENPRGRKNTLSTARHQMSGYVKPKG